MKRRMSGAVLVLLAAAAISAQEAPKGWKLRVDRSTSASDPDSSGSIKFSAAGSSFHATTPQAAVFWNPANTASGAYSLKGTFTLVRPSNHVNYYGLVFGGSGLEGAQQSYVYFTVAQNGSWLIKRRDGDGSPRTIAQMTSDAVKKPDSSGQSVNALEVRVAADKVDCVVNGTVVYTAPRSTLAANTDGIYGFRVNHQLEVRVDGLTVTKS
jgi:hypothetical protein